MCSTFWIMKKINIQKRSIKQINDGMESHASVGVARNWNRHVKGKDDDCLVICKEIWKEKKNTTKTIFFRIKNTWSQNKSLVRLLAHQGLVWENISESNFSCLYFNSDLSPFLGVKIITQQVQPSKILPKPVTATLPSSSNSPIMVVSSNGTIMTTKLVTTPTGKLWFWEGKGG